MNKILVNKGLRISRIMTSPMRKMPDFLIIGAQKCGTTSLFNYLVQHPDIGEPHRKEISYFSYKFSRGTSWYKSFFPIFIPRLKQDFMLTGEATTEYICYPNSAKRIAQAMPNIKLITLLRNPIDRAYSHYHHTKRMGMESLSFEEAITKEDERVEKYKKKILEDENYYHSNYHYYTYLSRGIYADQIKDWLQLFNQEQILVLKSEDFFNKPSKTFKQVLEFLELPSWEPKYYKQLNSNSYQNMIDSQTREKLVDYYKPHNKRLYQLLDVNFNWDQ